MFIKYWSNKNEIIAKIEAKSLGVWLLLCLSIVSIRAQNLVPNGDFESYDQCPDVINVFNGYVAEWSHHMGFAGEFYHKCGFWSSGNFPPRSNSQGNCSMTTYRKNSNALPRAYINNRLKRPLRPNELIYISYWVRNWSPRSYYIEDYHIYFSDTAVSKQPDPGEWWIELPAQVEWTGGIIRDSGYYVPITGCFVAEGGEEYITLGNFKHPDAMRVDSMHPFPQGNSFALDDVKMISEGEVDFQDTVVCPGSTYRFHDPYDMNFQARSLTTGEQVDSFIMPNEIVELEIFLPECGVVDTINVFPEACEDCYPAFPDVDICILDSIAMDSLLTDDTELLIGGQVYQREDVYRPTTDTNYWAVYRSAYCDTIALVAIEVGSCASCSPTFPDIALCPGDVFTLAPYQPFEVSIDGSRIFSDTIIVESGVYSILLSTAVCDTVNSFELEVQECVSCSDFTDTLPRVQCPGEVFDLSPFEGYDVYFEGELLSQDTILMDSGRFGIVLGSAFCDTLASFEVVVDSCHNCISELELDAVELCINEELPTDVLRDAEVYWADTPDLSCPGVYKVHVGHENCSTWEDSVRFLVSADRACYSYALNDSLCEGEPLVVDRDASLELEFGDQIVFNGGYRQRLQFTDVNCPEVTFAEEVVVFDCKECRYAIPNIFSPNGDGINDIFAISVNCPLVEFEAEIYDRWGGVLHQSSNPDRIWEGADIQPGVYVYRIQMSLFNGRESEQFTEVGTITLVR